MDTDGMVGACQRKVNRRGHAVRDVENLRDFRLSSVHRDDSGRIVGQPETIPDLHW
jgi:hypothetical protein